MQGIRLAAISDVEKTELRRKNFQSVDREILVKGTGLRCVLEGYVKDNYYARFQTRSYL